MSNKRQHERAQAKGVAAYMWVHEKLSSAIIENISAGGLFFRTPKPVPQGTPVRIRLVQPGMKDAVELTGRAVSAIEPKVALAEGHAPGTGIQFDPVPVEQMNRFNVLLTSLGLPPVEGSEQSVEAIQQALAAQQAAAAAEAQPPPLPQKPPPLPTFRERREARQRRTPSEDSGPLVNYAVHDEPLKIDNLPSGPIQVAGPEALPADALQPVEPSVPAAVAGVAPEPVSFEFELVPASVAVEEDAPLIDHVEDLMRQLSEAHEQIEDREVKIHLLESENERLQEELDLAQRALASAQKKLRR